MVAISLVKRGFLKAWGLSPPSSPNLLSLVTPITSNAHNHRSVVPVHRVLSNRLRVTYSNLYMYREADPPYLKPYFCRSHDLSDGEQAGACE
jgi:hypothetical protein